MVAAALFGLGVATTILGTAAQVGALDAQAKTTRKIGRWQYGWLQKVSKLERENARLAVQEGQRAQDRTQTQTAQFIGKQRAALAANGILVDEGSAANIVQDTQYIGDMAVAEIWRNTERAYMQHVLNAESLQQQSMITLAEAYMGAGALETKKTTTILSAVGSLGFGGANYLGS